MLFKVINSVDDSFVRALGKVINSLGNVVETLENVRCCKLTINDFWKLRSFIPCVSGNGTSLTWPWASTEQFSGVGKLYSGPGKGLFQHFSFLNSYSN